MGTHTIKRFRHIAVVAQYLEAFGEVVVDQPSIERRGTDAGARARRERAAMSVATTVDMVKAEKLNLIFTTACAFWIVRAVMIQDQYSSAKGAAPTYCQRFLRVFLMPSVCGRQLSQAITRIFLAPFARITRTAQPTRTTNQFMSAWPESLSLHERMLAH